MSSNDFFSLVEEYKKKKKKGITTTTSVRDEEESGEFWDLVDQYRGKDNIAPVSSQSIIKNAVREEIAPVSMAQKILGSGMDDETMLSSFSLAEFRAAKDEVSDRGDQVRLQSLFNQKLISNNAEILSKTKMDGKEHSVLEEMNLLAKMDSGDEKDERKSAVLKKMEELGLSTDDYAMYAGDSNFSWENFGNWAGNAAMSGLASFNKGITSTVDLILGNPLKALGWENNPVSEIADYYSDIYDSYKFKTDLYAQKLGGGKGYDFASSAIEGTMGAVPNAILALITAGTSMAGTAATTTSSLTTQAAYQSGNILTKAGLTTEAMMKNPQYWLSFARTYGTDYEEAKSMGASDTAAVLGATLTSLVNAGIEIGTDGLSGIQGLPQEIAEEGGSKLLKWAISNVEEGGEEGLQKFVNEVVAKTMYNHDLDILNPKEYLEEMAIGTISGAALGGGQIALQGASNAVGSAVQNYQDHQLTENEQKVVDKVVEDRIAEKEKDGTKLTKKEKSEIHEEVFQQMKKGYISIETIEEGLGDRSSYDALEKEAKEFDTLYNTATGQLSKAQQNRLAELEAKNNENPYKDALAKSKEQYSKGVFDMVKGDRLSESYREKDRVYQDFQADFDKYKGTKHEEAARKTLESALKAGANNTNRVHDLVDMAAQISADTGRTFEFKSGEQIKNDFVERQTKVIAEMEKIPAAKRTAEQSKKLADLKDLLAKVQSGETVVNGDITADGIVLNLDSGKPLNRTVGHEVTHSLENAKSYKELKDSLYAYAKSKGIDIDNELNTRKLMYEGVADADPEAELIADLVGDFLFTDSEYVRKLSTENQNVFQKFWDKIKYLCKVATAGSQEARELARVEKAFADAYREGGKAQSDTKYSISAKTDTAYMDAVNRGDTETAQRMVDEAAKNAGFPVRLLHGTQKFGFTVTDTSLSDDKLSFFATSDVDTAKTYSSLGGKRGISEDADYDSIDEESASHEENARDMADSLADKISRWAGYYGYVDGDYIHERFRDIADDYERGRLSQDEADQQMYEFADELIAHGYSEDAYDGMEFWEWQESEEADSLYTEASKTISAYFALADFNRNADSSGNYDLYANTDGLLVIEGNGAKWNDIKSDILPDITSEEYKKYGYRGHWDKWTTRSVSKYASDNGYRGVLFKNIYDDGGKSSSAVRKPADVYSFFYPQEQVKSADPVTYDDNGNVIPLSERFNAENPDIRYSLSDSDAMEQSINDLRSEIETVNDDLMFAEGDEYRTLSNKLVKLNHELDKLLAQERKATKKTPLKTVLDNLNQYRRSDLESLAEQLSDGAWDGYEDLSRTELEDGIREIIEEKGYSPIEMQNAKHGLWVRPVESAKYSLSDSDGNQLTEEQGEFFKDSKVRDDLGRLLLVYHGSANEFTVFNGRGNSKFGEYKFMGNVVNYFTTSRATAEDYSKKPDYSDGNVYAGYVNITQPYTLKDENDSERGYSVPNGLKNRELREFQVSLFNKYLNKLKWADTVDEVNEMLLPFNARVKAYEDLDGEYTYELFAGGGNALFASENFVESGSDFYDLFYDKERLVEEILGVSEEYGDDDYFFTTDEVVNLVIAMNNELGTNYDGVIIDNIFDAMSFHGEVAKDVITIKSSNQFKNADNKKPTSDSDIRYSMSSMANTFFGDENMTAEQFKKADYRQTQGYKDYVDQCLNNYRQTSADFDEATARKSIEDSIEGIVKVAIAAKQAGYDIYDDSAKRSKKDSKKRLLFSSLEPNSDYFTSSDISTICDKRKNFAEIYDDIVRAEEAKGVPKGKRFFDNVDNYFAIHKIMADKGLTTPCRQCYVESMRKNLAPMANAFLRLVQETNPDNTANDQLYHQKGKQKGEEKTSNAATREFVLSELIAHPEYNMSVNDLTVETLTTADGLAQLKLQAPTIYEAFNSFYGQSKPKMPKGATPFRFGELTALLTDEKGKIKKSVLDKINSTGGFRLQSYSDFQIQNYTDVLQVLFEAGTLGLKGHAYTKVPAFLDATEGTNLKRNISIFMYKDGDQWKLDKNDSFPYDLEEIYDLVKADESGNTGIIAVSQNADMSAWIMANDYVGYGIPFHKSGLKMGTVRDTDVKTEDGRIIKGYSGTIDHTKQQTEVWAKAGDGHKAETKVKKGINIYSFWDFDNKSNLSKNELIEKNVKAYIDQCEMAGYLPKFRAYVMNNGKVLNDVLKYSKELGFVGEDATIEDISFQYKGYTIPYGYYKFLGDFGMFTPDGKASAQKTLSLENYDFDKAVKFFSDSETLRRNEILQQFANGEERQRYRDSDLTAGELQDIVKQKRREVAESVVGDIAPSMSLSSGGDQFAPTSSFDISGKDFRVKDPTQETVSEMESVVPMQETTEESSVTEDAPVDVVEDETTTEDIDPVQEIKTVKERLSAKLTNSQTELANVKQLREESSKSFDEKIAKAQALLDSKKNQDTKVANNIKRRIERLQRLKADVDAEYAKRINDIESKVTKTNTELEKDHTKQDNLERAYARIDAQLEREKAALDEEFNQRRESLKDKNTYISQKASELYNEIRNLKKGVRASDQLGYLLDTGHDWSSIRSALVNIKHTPGERVNLNSAIESIAREMLNEDYENSLYNLDDEYQAQVKQLEEDAEKSRDEARKAQQRVTRKNLHAGIVDKIKARFAENGFDFDSVLKKAKNLSTFATVDNTPQRVMEKSLGYKEGGVLADLTVNKVAQNETEGIKWLNSFTDRKSGLLANISKQYGIKPGSKASAAAQMYAEGFYVNDNNEIIQYGDAELAQDFKDAKVRENIKKLARDPRIRQIYDETLAMINESRVRNGYPEIPRLDNYFLHFRAMDDTFSRLGLPFNPNDIKAKDLPTDLNGVTADLKPGQPYFASAMHRTGKRTSFDLLGGLEKYLTSAKNQIYHIDDIQTLRALRNYIADAYGQANGLEGLDALTEEEAQDRIEKVYNSHLSTFAKFLNEEANILAGKTALIDRGLEGIIGRRGITFLNTVNGQVGSNMVGFNLSSSLTNFLPVAQTFAKTNKADFVKAFGQTVANKVGSVFGRSDGFTENSPVVIRRKGADRFHRTPYQKVGDLGYVFMSAVDDISTELIARTKYNELTRKGMDSQQAHYETDKWVSRLMGDRSLGQMPQIYNSKMLGLITKFQLEVRNQLDSQFYDTIQEAKVSNEDIQNRLERNAKTAAKVTSTFVQLAVAQHLFGMAFESVAGYNPAFDIIEVMIKALGWDDEEDSEDTALDNIEQGFFALLEDLPYTSTFTGGRIPIESALPIEQFVKGVDQYGNEKSRLETLGEVAPYYLLPGGYGQIKKTAQGLGMFSDEHPIAGSYTDSGALRFPVEDTWQNRLQAGLFGQYASQNAGYYFDNDIAPLKDKQIQEFIDVDMPIRDYWDYRKGLSGLDTLSEKADYIDSLDLTDEQKNILINNIADRKEDIDMSDYGNYGSFEEFDFAEKYPEKYEFFTNNGISYEDYASADEEGKRAYTWASENPGKYEMSKAISDDFLTYWQYKTELGALEGDKDANGKTISGSKKNKVIAYINDMDLDYGQKIILFKSEYNSDDTYNYDIIEYLNGRDDISYRQMETILKVLGFNVDAQGNITWD